MTTLFARMFNRKLAFLAVAIFALTMVCGIVNADTILIDFGRGTNVATGYTSVAMVGAPDSDGNTSGDVSLGSTGWTINVAETDPSTANTRAGNAGSGADVAIVPTELSGYDTQAVEDLIYGNKANIGAPFEAQLTVTISGLVDDGFVYDLLFYGSRLNNGGLTQVWSLTQGTGGADVTHNSFDNRTTVVDWNGISTNGSGIIEFTITSDTIHEETGSVALNFGEITSVKIPEPSTIVLSGLALAGLGLRRRQRA